jgi:hypothetical protein
MSATGLLAFDAKAKMSPSAIVCLSSDRLAAWARATLLAISIWVTSGPDAFTSARESSVIRRSPAWTIPLTVEPEVKTTELIPASPKTLPIFLPEFALFLGAA